MASDPTTVSAGDPADVAIPRLVEQQGERLYAIARRLCGNAEDAEDLVQETFLQAFRKWDQFEGRSDPATWLYTIATRACHRMRRRRAGQPAHLASLDQLLPFADTRMAAITTESALDTEIRAEAQERVEAAIAELPEEFRVPLVLKDVVGFDVHEVAEILDIKAATVKTRVHRARLRVRQVIHQLLPKRDGAAPAPSYSRQMCLDLLRAKLEALDHGVEFREEIICDRCRAVFAELDLGADLCRELALERLPASLARGIERALRDGRDD